MLTPEFRLDQDDDFIHVHIKAPYVKASSVDWYIDAQQFKFYVKPYFLRLTFESELVEDGREAAQYDIGSGWFHVKLPKAQAGERFADLDLHTKLLAKPAANTPRMPPSIEVVGSSEAEPVANGIAQVEDEFDWEVEQALPQAPSSLVTSAVGYGFDNKYSHCLNALQHNGCSDLTMLPDPDNATVSERLAMRLATEQAAFDEDYYLAELFDMQTLVLPLLQATTVHTQASADWQRITLTAASSWHCYSRSCYRQRCYSSACRPRHYDVTLTPNQLAQLNNLPKRELLVDTPTPLLMLTMLDMLLAYRHELRVCQGDLTSESSTTISRVSSSLSVLLPFASLQEAVTAFCRRSLCFPLRRHWLVTMMAVVDTIAVLRKGKRAVLIDFLELRALFMKDDARRVLADIYMTDYCIWLQSCSDEAFSSLAEALAAMQLSKADVDLNLPAYDAMHAAILAQEQTDHDKVDSSDSSDDDTDDSDGDSDDESDSTDSDDMSASDNDTLHEDENNNPDRQAQSRAKSQETQQDEVPTAESLMGRLKL
eukprot:TRINITY_DN8587_c0_g1_i1.p1 TRINITY_DN8587_c0_g1~~TRINITY_DN8587_c0_g1_i1.p1  ORF type:complete len:540 (+),score=128.64 TRINITY_DN8587_c0_g1_i1:95-1714(+)